MPLRRSRRLPVVPPLDYLSVSASGAWGLRRLRAGYLGAAIRIRRSNDNAETDIYFGDDGSIDVRAVLGFTGTNSAYVTTWYDQSGNSRNLTQGTAANQPRIVSSGTLDRKNERPTLVFSGGQNINHATGNVFGTSGLWSANAVTYVTNASGVQLIADADQWTITVRYAQFLRFNGTNIQSIGFNTVPQAFTAAVGTVASGTLLVASSTRSSTTITAYKDGTAGTGVAVSGTASNANAVFNVGRSTANEYYLTGGISELVLVPSALSTADRNLLERNQGVYYGVTVA